MYKARFVLMGNMKKENGKAVQENGNKAGFCSLNISKSHLSCQIIWKQINFV